MTELNRSAEAASLGDIDTTQAQFREQVDVVADELRQLAGNADVPDDPLTPTYTIYVDAYRGSDVFVSGDFKDTGDVEARISLQRLEAGYTQARPFRTINRAVIEAAIITSRTWFTTDAERNRALVSIQVMTGEHTVLNGEGSTDTMDAWDDDYVPTDDDLTAFNPTTGGLILPRGVSVNGMDLRKTLLRPDFVPTPEDEADDYGNRSAIFLMTGGGYYSGFTFKDQADATTSHHLLSCFAFASDDDLNDFYLKIREIAGDMVDDTNGVAREDENRIVGPKPVTSQTIDTDTVDGASPYIFHCSVRSILGLCGAFLNGDTVTGFDSCVMAQFTAVSLQTDLNNWEVYDSATTSWGTPDDYATLIDTSPNDVRQTIERRSFHIRAVNNAICQEVSVFAIGHGVHHLTESGGELTITNSNSNFGGCALLSEGFKDFAAPQDEGWTGIQIRRAVDPLSMANNMTRITIGQLVDTQDNDATTLELVDEFNPGILSQRGYALNAGDFVWIDNPGGADYRAQLADPPWDEANPNDILLENAAVTDDDDGNRAPGTDGNILQDLAGKAVYVRRIRDVRDITERRYSVILQGDGSQRRPVSAYVVQPATGNWNERIVTVANCERTADYDDSVLAELKTNLRPEAEIEYDEDFYYRPGDTIRRDNKHFTAARTTFGTFDADRWTESFVHTDEAYVPPGFFENAAPVLTFDTDLDQAEDSTDLGVSLTNAPFQAMLRSGVDYQGAYNYLRNIGETDADAHDLLAPQPADSRDAEVDDAVELRRPSVIRAFGQAFEWAGFGNYTKALPLYQQDLTDLNRFTYYFTNVGGGKVYASGFNEEGFLVTNRGLEEVETGRILGFEAIADPENPIEVPTVENATTTQRGIVELATVAEVDGGTDDQRAVTPASLANVVASISSAVVPTGTVMNFAGTTAPDGWLEMNGQTVTAAAFPDLVEVLTGSDTATEAVVPDMRGEFVRGWDNGRDVDTGRDIATAQDDTTRRPRTNFTTGSDGSHSHSYSRVEYAISVTDDSPDQGAAVNFTSGNTSSTGNHTHTINGGDDETRPRNIALMFIIKD